MNKDGKVNIQDITTVAVAFGSKLGDAKWNQVAHVYRNGSVSAHCHLVDLHDVWMLVCVFSACQNVY